MGQTIELQAADGTAEAYLTGDPGDPGVLFYIDAIGLRPQIERWPTGSRRGGTSSWPRNVFYRDGSAADLAPKQDLREPGAREEFFASGVGDRVQEYTPDRSMPDAEAWLRTLREHAGAGPIGVTGYCMGARLAVRTSGQFPGTVAAVGGFHGGGLVTDAADSPHLAIAGSTAEFVFGHADNDRGMTVDHVAALEQTPAGSRAAAPQRDLPGRAPRLLDGRHLDVPGGRRRAALQGARRTARANLRA